MVNPVRGILGYQAIILEECRKLGLDDLLPSFEKVLVAAIALGDLVDGLRDPAPRAATDAKNELADEEAKLRHGLRTSLNAVIGYPEMVVEDIAVNPGAAALLPDLERLLEEARQLLGRVDAIVNLARGEAEAARSSEGLEQAVVADLLHTLRQNGNLDRTQEVGHVLVVEDNASNRDLLARRLVHEGHEVVTAGSGAEKLNIFTGRQITVDLILLDLLMPDMNDLEMLTRFKADERWQQIPVIMISGLQEIGAVLRCIEVGIDDRDIESGLCQCINITLEFISREFRGHNT